MVAPAARISTVGVNTNSVSRDRDWLAAAAVALRSPDRHGKHLAHRPSASRGSWALPAPSGAYAELPAWWSAEAWFDAVMDALRTPEGEGLRRRARVAADTLLRVAYADRLSADRATGRDVCTAHETVAAQLGMSSKTVQRARHLLEALGLAVTVAEGRYLTTAEREQARLVHGSDQVRAASTRALVMPATATAGRAPRNPRSVENVHLPVSPSGEQVSHVLKSSPTRAHSRAREGTAARRPATTKRNRPTAPEAPRAIAVQQLAARLASRMPWLDRGAHIGRVCSLIERMQLVERGWTVQQIVDRIDDHVRGTGIRIADPDDQRDPLGYLAWMLRAAVPADELAPFERVAQERRERMARAAAQSAAEAARRAQIDAEQDAIEATLAAMRAQFPRLPKPQRLFV